MIQNIFQRIYESTNTLCGTIITLLIMIFGEHWFLFSLFLFLNFIDWITGWMKAKINAKENSQKGFKGILKKLSYWIMILVAFMTSAGFVEIGKVLEINLEITTLLGWFVLSNLIVNELRSILENFIESGINVPTIFSKGLEVANKVINKRDQDNEK